MDDVKMGMSVSLARSALNIQANMSAALINGTIDKGAEMEQNMRSYVHAFIEKVCPDLGEEAIKAALKPQSVSE